MASEVHGDLRISAQLLEFGHVQYSIGSSSQFIPLTIQNGTEKTFELNLSLKSGNSADFPVQLFIICDEDKAAPTNSKGLKKSSSNKQLSSMMFSDTSDSTIVEMRNRSSSSSSLNRYLVIKPQSTVVLKAQLAIVPESLNQTHLRTSFFNVIGKCKLKYRELSSIGGGLIEGRAGEPIVRCRSRGDSDAWSNQLTTTGREADNSATTSKYLDLLYSATLCTSLMYSETKEILFNDCAIGQWYMQEMMIWNRSESTLEFSINRKLISETDVRHPLSASEGTNHQIKFFEGDNGKEITLAQRIQVPAFAPKLITLKVYSKTLGHFRFMYEIRNMNNLSNHLMLDIVGHAVKDRKHYLDNLIIHDKGNSTDWYCSNSVLPLNLGDLVCGMPKMRNFSFINKNPHNLELTIDVSGDDGQEIRVLCDGDDTEPANNLSLDMFDLTGIDHSNNIKPVESVKKQVSKPPKFDSNVPLVLSAAEAEAMASKETINVAKFCGQWFGNEYVESELSGARAYELQNEFGIGGLEPFCEFRPFLSAKAGKKGAEVAAVESILDDSQSVLPAYQKNFEPITNGINTSSAQINSAISKERIKLTIPANGEKLLTLEVTPSIEFQISKNEERYSLIERNVGINISYAGDTNVTTRVNLSYRSWLAEILITPSEYNVGLCNIGEAYPFTIIMTNLSHAPAVVNPSCPTDCKDFEVFPVSLDALESKEVTVVFTPTTENHDYHNSITFTNAGNKQNVQILKISGRAVDTEHAQIHDLFYKILDGESHNQSQIQFGKTLAHMVNISSFRLKNISSGPLQVEFHGECGNNLEIFVFQRRKIKDKSFSSETTKIPPKSMSTDIGIDISTLTVDEKDSTASTVALGEKSSRLNELEDLKWGKKSKSNARLSLDDDTGGRLRGDSKPKGVEKQEVSQSLNALDLTPASTKQHQTSGGGANALVLPPLKPLVRQNSSAVGADSADSVLPMLSSISQGNTITEFDDLQELIRVIQNQLLPWIFDEEETEQGLEEENLEALDEVSASEVAKIATDSQNSTTKTQKSNREMQFLELLQETYKNINSSLGVMRKTLPMTANDDTKKCETLIPQDSSVHVVVVWKPVLDHEMQLMDIGAAGHQLRNYLQIKLPQVTKDTIQTEMTKYQKDHIDQQMQSTFDELCYHTLHGNQFVLTPRSLLVRCECYRSEMTILQRNINYGRVVVGDSSTKSLTIINKSPVACIYSFSKSGNISSGFVTIVDGRKGIILPFSSKTVQIMFKPTMASTLEEQIQIKNLLNPMDEHLLTIKAKVSRAESFALTIVDDATAPQQSTSISLQEEDISALRGDFKKLLKNVYNESLRGEEKELLAQSTTNRSKNELIASLGISAVGRNPTTIVKMKIRNPTNKRRQFIFDADSVTLLDKTFYKRYDLQETGKEESTKSGKISILETVSDLDPSFIIPIPEHLENVLTGRCIVTSEVLKSGGSSQDIDEDLIQSLMDNLEKFQQKLKIAIRKAKPEKIVKYQKKIDDTIRQLSGASSTPAAVEKQSENNNKKDVVPAESSSVQTSDIPESNQYLFMEPDEERLVTLKITYFPSSKYKSWKGILAFIGKLRVFEVKNEDIVKTVYMGIGLFSSVASMESPTGEDIDKSKGSIPYPSNFSKEGLVVIQSMYSLPTQSIIPNYHKFSASSIKLSRLSSSNNCLTGCFGLSHIDGLSASCTISLEPIVDESSSYQIYDETCGKLNLIVADQTSSMGMMSDTDGHLRADKSKESKLINATTSFTFDISKKSSHREFHLVLEPLMLDNNDEFRVLGALKFAFAIGTSTYSLVVPFVCVQKRNSIIQTEKQLSIENVVVGSSQVVSLTVQNGSSSMFPKKLHYRVILEKLSEKNASRGSLEIFTGKTGFIPYGKNQTIKFKFNGFSAGRFEQKIWIQNVNDIFDQRRVVFNAKVNFDKHTFVEFPDLILLPETGKYKPIEFGKFQIRSQDFDIDSFHASSMMAVTAPYQLRIRNVSNRSLSLTAVPNLRNQCFVFSDAECKQPAVDVSVNANVDTVLYVVLKPIDLSDKYKKNSKGGPVAEENNAVIQEHESRNIARELIGGIRLIFFSSNEQPTQYHASAAELQKNQEQPSAPQSFSNLDDENDLFRRKMFETAISFSAIVGRSHLQATLVGECDGILVVNQQYSEEQGQSGVEYGTLRLSNQSDIFPLHYAFYDDPYVTFESSISDPHDPFEHAASKVKLHFECDKYGELNPKDQQEVRFRIKVGEDLKGFYTKSIRLCNLDTNEILDVCLALFIDARKLRTIVAPPVVSEMEISHSMPSVRSPPTVRIPNPFWLKHTDPNNSQLLLIQEVINLAVVKSDSSAITTLKLQNISPNTITLVPMTDLPVKVTIETEDEDQPKRNEESKSKSSATNAIAPPIISTSKLRRRFRKCGDVFSLRPNSIMIVKVFRASGSLHSEMSKLLDTRKLAKSNFLSIQGSLCFVERLNVLQSMFMPPSMTSDGSSATSHAPSKSTVDSSNFSGNDFIITSDFDHFFPVLSVTELQCKFILPKLRIKPTEVDLGRIRLRSAHSFDLTINTASEMDSLCLIDAIPPWITLLPKTKSSVIHFVQSIDGSKVLFYCKTKAIYDWKGIFQDLPTDLKKSAGVDLLVTSLPNMFSNEEISEENIALENMMNRLNSLVNHPDILSLYLNPQKFAVKFKIDRRSALEVAAISNEKLISVGSTTASAAITTSATPVPGKIAPNKNISSLFRYNFLRSFLIPPSFSVEVNEPVQDFIGFYEKMAINFHVNETAMKQGCKLSVKNIFDAPLKVSLEFEFTHGDLLSHLIDITSKFEHTTSTFVELLPEESVQVRIRAIPKAHATITAELLEKLEDFAKVDFSYTMEQSKSQPLQPNKNMTIQAIQRNDPLLLNSSIDEGLANILLKLRSSSFRLGKLYLRPSLDDISTGSQSATAESTIIGEDGIGKSQSNASKVSFTDADGVCIDIVGALKFGPTTRVIYTEEMSSSHSLSQGMSGNAPHEIIGGLVLHYECDNHILTQNAKVAVVQDSSMDQDHIHENKESLNGLNEISKASSQSQDNLVDLTMTRRNNTDLIKTSIGYAGNLVRSATKLLSNDQSFYVSNPTNEVIHFKIQSASYRYPGARMLFTHNIATTRANQSNLDQEHHESGSFEQFSFWTDTLCMEVTPSEGSIPIGSAIRFSAKVIPGNPSDAFLLNERLPGKDFHQHTNVTNSRKGEDAGQLMLCLPIEIWDRHATLHPPSIVYAHILSPTHMQPLRSQPISEINRQKQHLDLALLKADPDEFLEVEPAAEKEEDKETEEEEENGKALISAAETSLDQEMMLVESTPSISTQHTELNIAEDSTVMSKGPADIPVAGASPTKRDIAEDVIETAPSRVLIVPAAIMKPSLDSSMDLMSLLSMSGSNTVSGLASPAISNVVSSPITISPAGNMKRFRLRGTTPHPHLSNFSYIDFGRQLQRQEYIEWLITIENISNNQSLYWTIEAYPVPYQKKAMSGSHSSPWIQLGQSGGFIPVSENITRLDSSSGPSSSSSSSSIMLYFHRGNVGQFGCFLIIRDLVSQEYQVVRAVMQVTSDDWRKRSSIHTISISTHGIDQKLCFSWLLEYCQLKFKSSDDNLFAFPCDSMNMFVLKPLTQPMYKLQHLEIGSLRMTNQTTLPLQFMFTVSAKWINALVIQQDQAESMGVVKETKISLGSGNSIINLEPNQELLLNININPSSYKSAIVRNNIDSELLSIDTTQSSSNGNSVQKLAARILGSINCICRNFDGLQTVIPIHELAKL